MGRVAVVTVARADVASALRRDTTPAPPDPAVITVAHSCIKSARKILGLFEDLHKTGNITRFSFTDFQGCSIATIVLLVGSLISGEQKCRTIASTGLDYLRLMAGKQVTPLKGVRFVEAVQTIVVEASLKASANKEHCTTSTSVNSEPAASDYNHWAEWLQTVHGAETERTSQENPAGFSATSTPSLTQNRHVRQQGLPASLVGDFTDANSPVAASQSIGRPVQEANIFPASFGNDSRPIIGDQIFSPSAVPTLGGSNGIDHDFMMDLIGLGVLDFADETDMDLTFGSTLW